MDDKETIDDLKKSDFIRMAELSQQSFDGRRRYEWQINFGLWAALALVAYACVKERIQVFLNGWEPWIFGIGLFIFYCIHQIMISNAHSMDKHWKHYYLERAEGFDKVQRPKPYGPTPSVRKFWWIIAQLVFTAAILILGIRVLLRIVERAVE